MQTSNDPNPSSPGTEQENFRVTTIIVSEENPAEFLISGLTSDVGPFGFF